MPKPSQRTQSAKILAANGGQPVRRELLPYGRQSVTEADIRAVNKVLRSHWLTTGPMIQEFETAFAQRVGANHAVTFSSGTAALHGAMWAAGIGPGAEVITTPLTFCATSNAVLYQQGRPVFADIDAKSLNLDPDQVRKKIGAKTKAIAPIDYAGNPADMRAFRELAKDHDLVLIEDAAHALGATKGGRPVGSLADFTVFSFHPVKHITTGEGGMVTTDDPKVAARLATFRNHGNEWDDAMRAEHGEWFYRMVLLGHNYRMTDIGAALGLSQLARLDRNLARRRAIARRYETELRGLPLTLPHPSPGGTHAWHLYTVRLQTEKLRAGRREIFRALRAENIGVQVHYIPVHLHPYYRERLGTKRGDFPVTEDAYDAMITLPLFPAMSHQDQSDVIQAVHKVLTHYAT